MVLLAETLTSSPVVSAAVSPAVLDGLPLARGRRKGESRWIDDWDAENLAQWESGGKEIAQRNLIFSILSEHIGFCVWSLWSVFVLFLGKDYGLSPAD